jgi:glycosyltransferase involved in cell wall biosynthesis
MAPREERPPAISVIIPAHNAGPTLDRALQAVCAQELTEPFEVIVVDDGSRDETAAIAESFGERVRLVRNRGKRGAGSARNAGVEVAKAPVLVFTDADCYPAPGWLERALAAVRSSDLVQGAVHPDPAAKRTPFDRTLSVERDRGFYQTANLIVRREAFEAAGGFRDWALESSRWSRLSVAGPSRRAAHRPVGEDTLFGWMACRSGARSAFAPDAVVHHAVFPGGIRDDIADRWQWSRNMPGLVRHVPELRETVFYRRWFFSRWTAQFDLAAAGLAAAWLTKRPLCLLAAVPYARRIASESRRYGRRGALRFAVGAPIVEAATLVGLTVGSVAWRRVVL